MRFNEDSARMKRKLEEMTTIAKVHVDLEPYPSSTSGGWGGTAVVDGTAGGYVWQVRGSAEKSKQRVGGLVRLYWKTCNLLNAHRPEYVA